MGLFFSVIIIGHANFTLLSFFLFYLFSLPS